MAPTWYFVLSSHSFLDRCVIAACIVCLFSNLPTNYLPRLLLYAQHFPNLRASERWDTKVLCSVSAPIDRRESFLKWVMIQGGQRKKTVKNLGNSRFKSKTPKTVMTTHISPLVSTVPVQWQFEIRPKFWPYHFTTYYFSRWWGKKGCYFLCFLLFFLDTGRTQRVCYCQTVESFSRDYFPQSGWCIARLLTSPWMGSQCRYRDKIPHPHIHIPYIQNPLRVSFSQKRFCLD